MSKMTRKESFDSVEFEKKYHCELPLGSFPGEDRTIFRLWAPTAENVILNIYHTGNEEEVPRQIKMLPGEKGTWQCVLGENLDGCYYTYEVETDGICRIAADPYARACGLNGERSMVIDLKRTNPAGWEQDRAPEKTDDAIIYEVHVKDFSWDPASGISKKKRGKFSGLWEEGTTFEKDGIHPTGVDYLHRLGVTHVELMPVYDFCTIDEAKPSRKFNWGYDPANYNIPEGSYSTDPYHGEVRVRELKEAIQALHRNGLRVIMDVVYNHTYHLNSCLFNAVPWYYYRRNADGSSSNGSGCGNDIASERSMCARYILDSVLYWAEEYHMDGFRFDLMGLLPVDLMNRIRLELDLRYGKGEKFLLGEPWRAFDTAVRPGTLLADKGNFNVLDEGIGAFCDSTRDAIKGNLMQDNAKGFVNGGLFAASWLSCCIKGWAETESDFCVRGASQTINYLSSHDDWTLWDRLISSLNGCRDYQGSNETAMQQNRLAAAMLFFCQGNVFLLSGEEFARTKQGVKNSYASPVRINQLDWGRSIKNADLVEYYRGLIGLRKLLPAVTDKSKKAASRLKSVREYESRFAEILLDNTRKESETANMDEQEASSLGKDRECQIACDREALPGRWTQILLLYNCGDGDYTYMVPDGEWQLLADTQDSHAWEQEKLRSGEICVPAVSAVILGRRKEKIEA